MNELMTAPASISAKDPPASRDNIPQELEERPQWIVWRFEDHGKPKPDKVPYNPKNRWKAKSNNSSTWGSYAQAVEVYQKGGYDGIGFMFSENDPYTGIDLDHSVRNGELFTKTQNIVDQFNSYTELSPSGEGVHIIIKGKKLGKGCKKPGIEVYDYKQFFTFTGNHLPGTPESIEKRQEELNKFYYDTFGEPDKSTTKKIPSDLPPLCLSDEELINIALSATNGEKFKKLLDGAWKPDYPSQSEADLAFCAWVAFYSQKNSLQMDRIVRRFGLMRDKWDRKTGDKTYGQITIEKAIQTVNEVYKGNGNQVTPIDFEEFLQKKIASSGKPSIIVSSRQLYDVSDEALSVLEKSNDPNKKEALFVRSGKLATIREDESESPSIYTEIETTLRGKLSRVADFFKINKNKIPIDVSPPKDIVKDILERGSWSFPPLVAIVEAPVLRPDGSILNTPGYDIETKLFYKPRKGLIIPEIPLNPTKNDISGALKIIDDVIGEFPFKDLASKAGTIGLYLTPFIRYADPSPVPMALVDSPQAGSGKTLITKGCALIATGSEGGLMSAPEKEEEWRKSISTKLLAGEGIITIDNIEQPLLSPSLATVLTAEIWSDRLLGKNENLSLPNLSTWIATGNNIRVKGDLARRCYWIRIDPKVGRPWKREGFKHPDLISWIKDHRGELLAALLTLARGWYAAGCPKADVPKIGSFEKWAETIGGILTFSGVKGFLTNLDQFYDEMDAEFLEWSSFFANWYELFKDAPISTRKLIENVIRFEQTPEDLENVLLGGSTTPRPSMIKIGKLLIKRADVCYGDFRFERAENEPHNKVAQWRVVKYQEAQK